MALRTPAAMRLASASGSAPDRARSTIGRIAETAVSVIARTSARFWSNIIARTWTRVRTTLAAVKTRARTATPRKRREIVSLGRDRDSVGMAGRPSGRAPPSRGDG